MLYPWLPGRWYDLPVVQPQNVSTDIDKYFRQWHTQRWLDVPGANQTAVNTAMTTGSRTGAAGDYLVVVGQFQ
ncbi:MAG: hypothetical protein U0559_10645 [Anaerolineae bacterium]